MLVFSATCFVLLAVWWRWTAMVLGVAHSTGLVSFTFLLALVCALSNVLYMPYMARLHSSYLTAYFVGMGLSALVPSLVSLAQGTMNYACHHDPRNASVVYPVFEEPRFDVRTYFLLMAVWTMAAAVAFTFINWFPECLHGNCYSRAPVEDPTEQTGGGGGTAAAGTEDRSETEPIRGRIEGGKEPTNGTSRRYEWLVLCLMISCAQMNSVVPNLQVYASLSYSVVG